MSGQESGKPGQPMPPDPITALAASAVQLHELLRANVAAGFTEQQAMQIVLTVLSASITNGA